MAISDYAQALAVARAAASQAAALLQRECARAGGPRGQRGRGPADAEAEAIIRQALTTVCSAWGYRGEETGTQAPAPGETHPWLVGPNDGTSVMHRGDHGHAVAIARLRDGLPVLGVVETVNAPDGADDRFAWAQRCGPPTRNGGLLGAVYRRDALPAHASSAAVRWPSAPRARSCRRDRAGSVCYCCPASASRSP